MDYTTLPTPIDDAMVPMRYFDTHWSMYRILELETLHGTNFALQKRLVL